MKVFALLIWVTLAAGQRNLDDAVPDTWCTYHEGIVGYGEACCPSTCGACMTKQDGIPCSKRDGGAYECCPWQINNNKQYNICTSDQPPPCVRKQLPAEDDDYWCTLHGGIPGFQKACCAKTCGECNTLDNDNSIVCSTRPGEKKGCCPSQIAKDDNICTADKAPPCVRKQPPAADALDLCTGRVGIYGPDQTCCPGTCAECKDDEQCSERAGGAHECCPTKIKEDNNICSEYQSPPCISVL